MSFSLQFGTNLHDMGRIVVPLRKFHCVHKSIFKSKLRLVLSALLS